jgi:hypothetical protein
VVIPLGMPRFAGFREEDVLLCSFHGQALRGPRRMSTQTTQVRCDEELEGGLVEAFVEGQAANGGGNSGLRCAASPATAAAAELPVQQWAAAS